MSDFKSKIISISEEMNERGLKKEALFFLYASSNIIDFKERSKKLRENLPDEAETNVEGGMAEVIDFEQKLKEMKAKEYTDRISDEDVGTMLVFIIENLMPDSKSEHGLILESMIKRYEESGDDSFYLYIIDEVADNLDDLARDMGLDFGEAAILLVRLSKSLPLYGSNAVFGRAVDLVELSLIHI